MWKEKEPIVISDLEKAEKISKLIETLEDNEDAQNVYSNFEVADEIADKRLNVSEKDIFLKKLKSKNGYKRYLGSPLRYRWRQIIGCWQYSGVHSK